MSRRDCNYPNVDVNACVVSIFPIQAQGEEWPDGWSYRKSLTIEYFCTKYRFIVHSAQT